MTPSGEPGPSAADAGSEWAASPPLGSVRVPATTANLGPGFDAFGAAVSLHLTAAAVARGARRMVTAGEGAGELPVDESNLLWRALAAFCSAFEVAAPDVSVHVRNDIPLERGLGSSAAAIVAGLGLARALTGVRCGDRDLIALAAELEGHPDNVVPAVLGGLTCTVQRGGELVVRRVQPHARLRPVLLVPAARQATAAARDVLPDKVERADAAGQAARAGHVLLALAGGWPVAPDVAGDLLHEPPRLAVMAPSAAVVAELRAAGVHAWLSGAGPSVAAAVPALSAPAVERCAAVAEAHGFEVRALAWDLAGLRDASTRSGIG